MKIDVSYKDIRKSFFTRLLRGWFLGSITLLVLMLQHVSKNNVFFADDYIYSILLILLLVLSVIYSLYTIWIFFKDLDRLTNRLKQKIEDQERVLATISHELRTPLNGILGMTQLLLDTPLNVEQLDFAKTTLHSGQNMLRLINDLLDLSKIDAGKMQTEQIDFDLGHLVYDVIDLMLVQAQQKQIELVRFASPSCRLVYRGDPSRIRQILLNLVGNAIKFTNSGYVCLHVDTVDSAPWHIESNTGSYQPSSKGLLFSIEDTGSGIAKEDQEKLFKFYAQANESTSRIFGGTGLGLALSKALANAMGGDIICESEVGKGSIFKCYIPIHSLTEAPLFSLPASFPDISLWVLESNIRNCQGLEEIATGLKIDHHTSTSWDILPQVAAAKRAGKNIVLQVDYRMLGDCKLSDKLKAYPELLDVPAILITFKLARQLAPSTLNAFTAIINKPVHVDKWLTAIIQSARFHQNSRNNTTMLYQNELFAQFDHPVAIKPLLDHRKISILLAEDNLVNQKVTVKMIEKLGDTVVVVENGVEVLNIINTQHFDLILMDCRMPEMDGLEATRIIRERQLTIPIVALTANEGEEEREACLASGMDEFVSKPIDLQKLSQVLMRYRPTL